MIPIRVTFWLRLGERAQAGRLLAWLDGRGREGP
jgi:hypothetical protein